MQHKETHKETLGITGINYYDIHVQLYYNQGEKTLILMYKGGGGAPSCHWVSFLRVSQCSVKFFYCLCYRLHDIKRIESKSETMFTHKLIILNIYIYWCIYSSMFIISTTCCERILMQHCLLLIASNS